MTLAQILILACADWYIAPVTKSIYTDQENTDMYIICISCLINIYYAEFIHQVETKSHGLGE